MTHEHHNHFALHLGFEIAKLLLIGATTTAVICGVKEIYKVSEAIKTWKH